MGLGVVSVDDERDRTPPTDLTDIALQGAGFEDIMPFGKARSYRFYLTHDYGDAIRLEDILHGTINAKVRVELGFFRRTWRWRSFRSGALATKRFRCFRAMEVGAVQHR